MLLLLLHLHENVILSLFSQFHQHFENNFSASSLLSKIQTQTVGTEKLQTTLSYEKAAGKMLMI